MTAKTAGLVLNDGSVIFGWFVRNRYFPMKEGDWSEETAKNKRSLIQSNLLDDLGEIPFENLDKFTLKMHVNKLAENCSKDTVLQMCAYLRDIFEEAVEQDFLQESGKKGQGSKVLRAKDETVLTWDQLRMALELLDERDRVLVELDMTDALRPERVVRIPLEMLSARDVAVGHLGNCLQGQDQALGKTLKSLEPVPPASSVGH